MSNRPTFTVTLDDDTTHTVAVVLGDQLRAELEGPRHGIPTDPSQAPLHTTTLWVWAAAARLGLTQLGFQDFRSAAVSITRVVEEDQVPVDPTGPGQPTG